MTGQALWRTSPARVAPGRRIAWWAMIPALLVVGAGLDHDDGVHPPLLSAALPALAGLAATTATSWPRASVLTNGAAVGAYFALGSPDGPVFLTVPLVAVLASQLAPPRRLMSPLAAALSLILAGLTAGSLFHGASGSLAFWKGSGLIALALAASVLGWWLTDRRAARQEHAQRAATEERLRMAQDLHDGVGHGLAVIAMHAAVALHVLDRSAGEPAGVGGAEARLRQSLEVIRDTGRESLDALRVQLTAISTGASDSRRPAPGLPELGDLLARVRTGGLAVTLHGDPGDVPEAVGQAVYAVVQESLTNVLRHAGAAHAGVTLARAEGELVVSIQDDGRGPGRTGAGSGAGMGIPGMRERVRRLGGTLDAGYRDGGYLVRAHLPVPA